MAKIRTLDVFQDYVDTEMAWRIKEIAHLTAAIDKSSSLAQRTMIRASILYFTRTGKVSLKIRLGSILNTYQISD